MGVTRRRSLWIFPPRQRPHESDISSGHLMSRILQILVCASLLATTVSSLRVYPHQLACFNEIAGGPEDGWRHLLGSNLDWGQDFLFLARWLDSIPSATIALTHPPVHSGLVGPAFKRIGHEPGTLESARLEVVGIAAVSGDPSVLGVNGTDQVLPNGRWRMCSLDGELNRIGFTHVAIAR